MGKHQLARKKHERFSNYISFILFDMPFLVLVLYVKIGLVSFREEVFNQRSILKTA